MLEEALTAWISDVLGHDAATDDLSGVSVDGKALCGTLRPFARAVHLVSLVDRQTGYVLSQCRVDEKTNEHKAALELLQTIVLQGRVFVGDAMFCQRDFCRQIVDSGGHSLVCVKENQPTLLREIELEPAAADAAPMASHRPPTLSGSVRHNDRRPARSRRVTAGSNAAR